MAGLLGLEWVTGRQPDFVGFAIWVAVVFASVMVHEMGHAVAIRRKGIEPAISLHMMGGLTTWRDGHKLSRPSRIFISFAGPLAGFVLGGTVFAFQSAAPSSFAALPLPAQFAVDLLVYVNIFWGLINLIPVLPLDGGHILEDALGPKRRKTTAVISIGMGAIVVLICVAGGQWWIAMLFGMFSFQSFQRFQAEGTTRPEASEPLAAEPEPTAPFTGDPISPQFMASLVAAKRALEAGRYDEAGGMAEALLEEGPPPPVKLDALHVVGWAHLLEDRPEESARVVAAINRFDMVDPALEGAVLFAQARNSDARSILERALSLGDDRKEIVGPLVQILIAQNEIGRAAALALDIAESLSDDDLRHMAGVAIDDETFAWASRLIEVVFERTSSPEDGYEAARLRALEGDAEGAIDLLRRAVAAGFSDSARAWSDAALEKLRGGEVSQQLADLLPRPDGSEPTPAKS